MAALNVTFLKNDRDLNKRLYNNIIIFIALSLKLK